MCSNKKLTTYVCKNCTNNSKCYDCYDEKLKKPCAYCNDVTSDIVNNINHCQSCYSQEYFTCDSCLSHTSNVEWDEHTYYKLGELSYCNDCVQQAFNSINI